MRGKRALFLDRDGVINRDLAYVHTADQFFFIDGVFELARAARARDMEIVVVTNQAGIGRGFYSEETFLALTAWMCRQFELNDANLAKVYYCPHHPVHGLGIYRQDSFERKPNPGMLFKARDELGVDLSRSILVGDQVTDLTAAHRAQIPVRCLFRPESRLDPLPLEATHCVDRLTDVIELLG